MMKAKTFKKEAARQMRRVKTGCAQDAIGTLHHQQDIYIFTYGQFSLIDALFAILDQTGPADVVMATWTAATANLEQVAYMMEAASIRRLRMIVDRSFRARQPFFHRKMRELFGQDCIRELRSHAKFMLITNDVWKIVIRTSMNLNENPRLENIEISDDPLFAEFMLNLTDEIFQIVTPGDDPSDLPDIPEDTTFRLADAKQMAFESLSIPRTTHVA